MASGIFQISFWSTLILYIGVGTALALIARKYGVASSSEYFAAGHKLGGLISAMTYAATTYSAFMMVGLVGFAYATGVGSLGFELSYFLVTLLLLSLLSKKVWMMGRSRDWVSASEMLSDLYDSKLLGMYVAGLYFVALIPYISAQFIGVGKIFEGLGLTYTGGVIFAAFLVLAWVVLAGMWSKATTDVFQGAWMIAAAVAFLAWIVGAYMPAHGISFQEVSKVLTDAGLTRVGGGFWTFPTLLAFTLPWWFFAVTNPQVVRKLFMPADERSLKSMIKYFGLYGLIYTLIVVFIGLIARGLTIEGVFSYVKDRDLVTPLLLLRTGPLLSSFIYVSIIAAAVTTANSIILSVTASVVRDMYEKALGRASNSGAVRLANALIIALTVAIASIALVRPSFIVSLSVLSSLILLPLAPATIAAWVAPEKAAGKYAKSFSTISVIGGTAVTLVLAAVLGPKALTLQLMGVPYSAWLLCVTASIVSAGFLL